MTLLRAVVRSPLVHFLGLGGLIFVAYGAMNPPQAAVPEDRIVLSLDEADRLAQGFVDTWGRLPSLEELDGLMQDWIVEEALVREARTLGLDQGDAIVRARLRQKMLFLAEAPVAGLVPDEATIAEYYDDNSDLYERPAEVSFAQVLLPDGADDAAVDALLQALAGGADPAQLGQATLLPGRLDGMAGGAADRVFGAGFGAALTTLPEGAWAGPVDSAYGRHLVRVEARAAPALPPLNQIRDRVIADWRADQARTLREEYIDRLMSRFSVDQPPLADVLQP
ncbi:hypothetical protein LA6_000692 [Marinibacterium anthonyi]|nr:hypothetical protein LA6_000692 [Marinibacterium anthonyi]